MSSPQAWTEISTETSPEGVDDLVALFGRYCTGGAVVEEMAGTAEGSPSKVKVKGFLPTWETQKVRTLEVAVLLLSKTASISQPETRILEGKDWAEAWKAHYGPLHIGAHTVIVPSWSDYAPGEDAVAIRLDPGMAFGTGQHATTRLCLVALERLVQPGVRGLDVGTGSGILAISAVLHGAASVDALDIDPVAVKTATENAILNGVGERVAVQQGTLQGAQTLANVSAIVAKDYDLVLINIFAEVIVSMAASIAGAVRSGGQVVASGIIAPKADPVVQALAGVGLMLDERLDEDDWVALLLHRA